ncbi:MAG: DUF533 domain-containing protein [Pseudomonadota bacterium]
MFDAQNFFAGPGADTTADSFQPVFHDSVHTLNHCSAVVHRLAVAGGLKGLGAIAWRVYQRYRVSQSMQIQHQRSQVATGYRQAPQATDSVAWMQLSRYEFDALWEERSTLSEAAGVLPLRSLTAAFADSHGVDSVDGLLMMLAEADLIDEDAPNCELLLQSQSARQVAAVVGSPEAAVSALAAALIAVDSQATRGNTWIDQLSAALTLPDGLTTGLRIRLHDAPAVPLTN